jgi:KipI family sensor histidine kinase inhibitor
VKIRAAGPRALLVEFDGPAEVRNYYVEARRRRHAGALPAETELIPADRTLLFDQVADRAALARELSTWDPAAASGPAARVVEIPTVYNGPDLADVAALWGVSVSEAVHLHTGLTHDVAFAGFAPGFAYISGIPAQLRVPRLDRPRTRVPAGSVALADRFTGIYPRESPGGWRLIGHTSVVLWDVNREPPAYLLPGDRVRFVAVPS